MEQIIAALDLGTSKSIAIVVRKDFMMKLAVLQTESIQSKNAKNAIRRGRIYNSDETSDIITRLIRKIKNNPDIDIEKFYVGIGGQSLHTQSFSVKRMIEEGTVTQQLLTSIEDEANKYEPEFEDNLGVVSREYYIDGQLVTNPKGTESSSMIEGRFLIVAGNPCLKGNLDKVFNGKQIAVADYFISPLATAEAVLTPEEKELGCALIEWGEGVTYVSVYKNKSVKFMTALPVGGMAITKDIRSLTVSEEEAEKLKIKYGKATEDVNDDAEAPVNDDPNSTRKIELRNLNRIIEARVNEILKNIQNQIQLSGYAQMLDAGIVITGGGALLKKLPQYIEKQTGKTVRLAMAKVWVNQIETQLSPSDSCVVGLAMMGKENCGKENNPQLTPGSSQGKPILLQGGKKEEKKKPDSTPTPPQNVIKKPAQVGKLGKEIKKFINMGLELFKDEDFVDNAANKPANNIPDKANQSAKNDSVSANQSNDNDSDNKDNNN